MISRRTFSKNTVAAALASMGSGKVASSTRRALAQPVDPVTPESLDRAVSERLLRIDQLKRPVVLESMELLRAGQEYLVRVRSKDGAEAVVVANSSRLRITYPIFLQCVAPFFVGKDIRHLEPLLEDLYRQRSNYKLQGLAFWVCVAAAEMALLDLLGRLSEQSIGELFGGVVRRDVAVYRASGNRGNRPEEEITYLRQLMAETGAKALKFRVGGRMSNNVDSLPGRSEALIPLVREAFGDEMTIYADSNSSYDVKHAIRIGRMMEEQGFAFFEEPCRFDHLWETKQVTQALDIPIAGGEQEFSLRRFGWTILNRGVDIVQPDLHYFGGYIRCTKVAKMAAVAGMPCTAHMSGSGLGFLNVLHFASYVPNAGAHQEFKGTNHIPLECASSELKCVRGIMRVPTGPGFGVELDPGFVRKAVLVKSA